MADLSYQDVQRAFQGPMRNLQSDMQRLATDISNLSNQATRIEEVQRLVTNLQAEIQRHDPRSEQTMQFLTREIQEMKVRLESVEKICREMSEIMRRREETEREDQEYRSISPE